MSYAETVSYSLQVRNPRVEELLETARTRSKHSSSVRDEVTGSPVLLPRYKAAEQLHGSLRLTNRALGPHGCRVSLMGSDDDVGFRMVQCSFFENIAVFIQAWEESRDIKSPATFKAVVCPETTVWDMWRLSAFCL